LNCLRATPLEPPTLFVLFHSNLPFPSFFESAQPHHVRHHRRYQERASNLLQLEQLYAKKLLQIACYYWNCDWSPDRSINHLVLCAMLLLRHVVLLRLLLLL